MTEPKLRACLFASVVATLVFACNALAEDDTAANKKNDRPAAPEVFDLAHANVSQLLCRARDVFIEDGSGKKASQQNLFYIWQREHINHTPLLHIAVGLANQDDPQAVDTANMIEAVDVRAFTLIQVSEAQRARKRSEDSSATLRAAADLIGSKQIDGDTAEALWPHVLGVLLKVHGDLKSAKAAAEKLGCPWDSIDNEERHIQLAQYHFSRGEIETAREDLLALPAGALAQRKGRQALSGDDGASFYGWIQQSVAAPQAYTADHLLLEWLGNDGKPEQIEMVLRHFDDANPQKLAGELNLAERYQKAGDADKAANAFNEAEKLIDRLQDEKLQERMRVLLLVRRPPAEGKTVAQEIEASGVLEKHRGEPWLAQLIEPLLEAGELPLAEKIASQLKPSDKMRGRFAIALTKAGKDADAMLQVRQATEPLGPAKIMIAIALQQKQNGDLDRASETVFEGIALARKVSATNNWFPEKGRVRLQDKWHVLDWLEAMAIELGQGDRVLREFKGEASVRGIATEFGARGELEPVGEWSAKFDEHDRQRGARCMALLGLAEGLARRQKR